MRFGEQIRVISFLHRGVAGTDALNDLYGRESGSPLLTLNERGELMVRSVSDVWASSDRVEDASAAFESLQRFSRSFQDEIQITWESSGSTFETIALVGDRYPYLVDTVITSVILSIRPENTSSDAIPCAIYEDRLLSFVKIAEYEARMYGSFSESPIDGDQASCHVEQDYWSAFGTIVATKEAPEYTPQGCSIMTSMSFRYPFSDFRVGDGERSLGTQNFLGGVYEDKLCVLP